MAGQYYMGFKCSPYLWRYDDQCRQWIEKNQITIHSVLDAGMHGNRHVHYSSPVLTGGVIRNGHGYESLSGHHQTVFSDDDPIAG